MTEARRNRLNTWVAILERKVATLYGETYVKALKLPEIKAAINANDTEFDWSKYPGGEAKLEKLITNLNKELNAIVASATASAYNMGASDADDEVKGLLGKNRMSKRFLAEVSQQAANQRREDGMTGSNYIHEKRGGFELSDRVWKVTSQSKQELTMMVQAGIIEGKSADEMSRDVRGNLQNPKMLFRRVRDKETGELRLSKAAKEYHPGQGVYRSSYKNAVRMTRTEVNQGYRVGEQQAYSNNPLVKGYDIMLSNNHTTKLPNGKKVELHDICDELAGRYPKTFVWSGWHPQCRCKMVPVPLTPEEFGEYMRLKKAGELRKWRDPSVKDYPSNFKDWVTDRKPLIEIAANRGKLPYFLQDNPYTWKERPRPTPIDIAQVRHDNRTEDQITAIRNKWAEHQRIQEIVRQIMRENSKPYYEGVYADEINACGSVKELSALMTSKGVTTSASFGTMTLSGAKEVCLAAAEMQKRFSLRAIEVKMGGSSRSGWYMRAHGGQVEINSGYWKAASIDDTLKKGFYDSVSNYVTSKKKAIDARNADIDIFKKRLADAIKNGDKSSESYYSKLIKKSEKEIKRIQDLIDAGVNRYNQFLSRETMLRDCFAHEMGHVTHDQVTGGINGAAFRRKRYDVAECAAMNSEIKRLYSKYSKGDKFVTEYGMTKSNEFLAESMVLYMYRPSKLPQDVFEWFEKLEKMAHGGKIPTKTISYDEAFEIYKQEYDGKMRIQRAAEKRHAARTPEREEEIREFWRKKKEEGDKRRHHEEIMANAEKRHAARTQEQAQKIIDDRAAELAQFAAWEKYIRDTDARAKLNEWLTDEEKVVWVDGSNGSKTHLKKYNALAKMLNDRMDVIDAMRPQWNLAATHTSVFDVYKTKLDEARRMIVNGFKSKAEDILKLADEIRTIEPRYVDMRTYQKAHPGKAGKKSKIEVALDEAEELIKNGDVAGALKKIEDAENTKKINEASARSKAEAAKRKKEEEARKKAEEAAKNAKTLRHEDCETIEDYRKLYGSDMPVITQNIGESVKREQYVLPEYIAKRDEIGRKFKDMFERSDFSHCTSPYALDGYFKDGILTNLQRDGDTNTGYAASRRTYGHFAFDLPGNIGAPRGGKIEKKFHLKPGEYYRCGVPCSKDPYEGYVRDNSGYGDAQLVFRKDRVIATFTMDNSLCERTIPSLTTDPKVCSLDSKPIRHINDQRYEVNTIKEGYSYVELQYLPRKSQGNFTPRDFQRIVLKEHPEKFHRRDLWEKWANEGVDIYYLDFNDQKAILYMKGKSLLTHEEAKVKLDNAKVELEDMFAKESILSNKDVSIKDIQAKMKSGDYIGALEAFDKYKNIEARKKNLVKLIPDVDKYHKTFTIDELEAANKAIVAKIDYMDNVFKSRNSQDDVLKKWVEEIDKAEHPEKYKTGAKRFPTWEIAKKAYERRLDELVYEFHKNKIEDDLKLLRGFNTKDKKFASAMGELESKVAAGEWASVETMIASAQDIMRGLGERILKLGESIDVKFTEAEFTQAKRDAARWFKDPDVRKAYKEADDYMSKYAQAMWKNLSDEEKHILWLYTDGSKYINDEMLGNYSLKCISPIDGSVRNGLADANVITSIIEKAPPLKEAMWMQSGKSIDAFRAMFGVDIQGMRDLSSLVGKECINSIFSSCHAASDGYFTKGGSTGVSNPIVMSIYMPAGTKGVYLEPIASYGDNLRWKKGLNWTGTKRMEAPSDQVEFLLQRGAKFRITNAYFKDGKWYVDVDLVEQTAVDALDTNIPNLMYRSGRTSRKPTLI